MYLTHYSGNQFMKLLSEIYPLQEYENLRVLVLMIRFQDLSFPRTSSTFHTLLEYFYNSSNSVAMP